MKPVPGAARLRHLRSAPIRHNDGNGDLYQLAYLGRR